MTLSKPAFRSVAAALLLAATSAFGQVHTTNALIKPAAAAPVTDSVIPAIDESKLTLIEGNTRPEALVAANDLGPVSADMKMEHMMLLLHPTPEKDAAFTAYVESLTDKKSPNFHKWLTAEKIGATYGPSKKDLQKITDWLTLKGFTVEYVYPNGTNIAFGGSATQVESAFHTSIHKILVNGEEHYANMKDISIPTALTSVVTGITTLHDIKPHMMHRPLTTSHFDVRNGTMTTAMPGQPLGGNNATGPHSNDTFVSGTATYEAVVPGDLSQIYRLFKLFNLGITGKGQTIVVIEDTDLYADTDVTTFQSTFNLTQYGGTHTTVHPTGGTTCTDPGHNADDGEATLDVEYSLATAPGATVELASCKGGTTFGGLIALNNLVASATPPAVVSISYGESEESNGATSNAAFNLAYKNAAAVGTSVFVSSGDEGAASTDANKTVATHGINVSGWASTPYNVAVGGTDFRDTFDGTNSTYWDTNPAHTNAAEYYQSALSYIPETPWADSCANYLIYTKNGYTSPYSTLTPAYTGYCNTSTANTDNELTTGGGSGGPSGCATGTASTRGVKSGTCAGYAKPSWQALVGVPADGVRDLPDISLFAANGQWGHYYPYCYTDPTSGYYGAPCTGTPDTWSGAGGTSFASPILASIQALINQNTGTIFGNPNPVYYAIAADVSQYGANGNSGCDSSLGPVGPQCVFHDITFGDIAVNCNGTGGYNCYRPTGTYGILSTSTTAAAPAYSATVGWDFATGIGSVNAQSLVNAFTAYYDADVAPAPVSVPVKAPTTTAPITVAAPTRSVSTIKSVSSKE